MLGQSTWKKDVEAAIRELQHELAELKRQNTELKAGNSKLTRQLKGVARKLVMRLPLSLESLEKDLNYDLIFPEEVDAWLSMARDGFIIDLRSKEEFEAASLPDAVNIPQEQLHKLVERIPKNRPLLLVCDNGVKSVSASELLAQKAFHFVYVLKGGMSNYSGRTQRAATEEARAADSAANAPTTVY